MKKSDISKQNQFDLKARRVWNFCPIERVKESKKVYNRQKWKRGCEE